MPKKVESEITFICEPNNPADPIMARVAEVNTKSARANAGSRIEYDDHEQVVELAKSILRNHGNLKVWGPTGTGKTTLCQYLAQEMKCHYYSVQMTVDTQTFNLISEPRIFDGQTKIAINTVVQFMLDPEPAILAIHEPNMAHGGVLAFLFGLTDDQRCVNVPDLGVVLSRGDDKYIIITYNPSEKSEYAGTQNLNVALLRRFEGFYLGYLPQTKEMKILRAIGLGHREADKLCQMAQFTRTAYAEGELITPITLGNLKAWAKMIVNDGLELNDVLRMILGMYPESQHGVITKFWGGNGTA